MNFSKTSEVLNDLRRGARSDQGTLTLSFGVSKLNKAVEVLKKRFGALDNQDSCPESIKERWLQAQKARVNPEFTQREARLLSYYSEIALSADFIAFVGDKFRRVPAGVLRGLLASYVTDWERANEDVLLNSILKEWVQSTEYATRFLWWRSNPQFWIDSQAADNLADLIVKRQMSADQAAAEFKAPKTSSLIRCGVSRAALWLSEKFSRLNIESLEYFFDCLLREPLIDDRTLHQMIRNMVLSDIAATNEEVRKRLVSAILTHPRLGDPRVHVKNWESPTLTNTKATFLGWLSVEDIRTFFEVILTRRQDTHGRKDFWLRYEKSIRLSRVFVSIDDRKAKRAQLEELTKSGRSFGECGDKTSIFVLDLGKIVAVEFSAVGNALYLYTKESFKRIMPDIFVSHASIYKVKNSDLSISPAGDIKGFQRAYNTRRVGGFSHGRGWQTRVEAELWKHGIRVDR
jgi:hypothetical protein